MSLSDTAVPGFQCEPSKQTNTRKYHGTGCAPEVLLLQLTTRYFPVPWLDPPTAYSTHPYRPLVLLSLSPLLMTAQVFFRQVTGSAGNVSVFAMQVEFAGLHAVAEMYRDKGFKTRTLSARYFGQRFIFSGVS